MEGLALPAGEDARPRQCIDDVRLVRLYHCVPGRLPDLVKRFDTLTQPLGKKHGIEQAGFWTVAIGSSNQDLYYMLKWDSLDERARKFAGFQADPEWVSGRAETEKNGPIVASITNTIMHPTSFSSVK